MGFLNLGVDSSYYLQLIIDTIGALPSSQGFLVHQMHCVLVFCTWKAVQLMIHNCSLLWEMVLQRLKPPWMKEELLCHWYPMDIDQMGS